MKKLLSVCLFSALLMLSACGGNETSEATPAVVATATEAAVVEATPTTEMTTTEEMTETATLTGTEEMTASEGLTGTEELTETDALTDGQEITGAGALTGTTEMTETAGMSETAGMEQAPRQLIRASTLQDYNVENAAGENLGNVQDLILNLDNGQILLVTVEYGGFLDIGDKVFPIPLSAFRFDQQTADLGNVEPAVPGAVITDTTDLTDTMGMTDTTGDMTTDAMTDTAVTDMVTDTEVIDTRLILDIPEETFQDAPGIEEDLNLTDPLTVGDIETFYRDLGEDVIGRPIAETNLEELDGRVVKLSDLDGANVQNPAGENVGEINDMLIDLRMGRVEYFILSFGGFLGIGDNEYAIPMDAFDLIPTSADMENGQPTLVLDITEEQLENAPVFDDTTLNAQDWDLDARNFWLENR